MRAWFTVAATLGLTLSAAGFAPVSVAAEAAAPGTGSAEAGAGKAAVCVACHGPSGNSANPEWPVLAGQSAHYLQQQITLFRDQKRPNPLMFPMVQNLSDQDILDISAYFSRQTPTGGEADPSYWKAGESLYRSGDAARGVPACMACHGPVGRGVPAAGFPALRAQHAVYTIKQLGDYAADTRYVKDDKGARQAGPNVPMMITIAAKLTAEDRRNLASYIQGMR
ncbi:MAG: cytochrome c4 [Steroidobacteraceae bacterium]